MYFEELRPRTTKLPEYWNSAATGDESLTAETFTSAISLLPNRSSAEPELRAKLLVIGTELRRNLRQDDWGGRGDQTETLRQVGKKIARLKSAIDELSRSEIEYFCGSS